jgi:hypothetical protein
MQEKNEKKSAVQSFKDFRNRQGEAFGSRAQHLGKGQKTRDKVLCFAQKFHMDQAEYLGLTSWMTGSMANPCISQWNCSEVMERSSSEERGHEKRPLSTLL